VAAFPASAQQVPEPDRRPAAIIADTLRAPVQPLPAFFRSLILPGWGQAVLDRKLTGGLFIIWEAVTVSMTLKAAREVRHLERVEGFPERGAESPLLLSKRAEREDWLVLLLFNHLFAGLEAYVSAHLWDFPRDVQVRMIPGAPGGAGAGLTLSLPIRLR
jgi:hypothetical protein